ncbi:MAG: cation:proton antiporter [Patescibacteria group bacterium]
MDIVLGLFFVVVVATLGGFIAKSFKLPSLVGYILAGLVVGVVLPESAKNVTTLAEFGIILLLFSIGVEIPLKRISKYANVAVIGAILQIFLVSLIGYFFLIFVGFNPVASLILSLGFSLSSTAVVVKMLTDSGEMETIHGGVMFGWLLVQDLIAVPIIVILPFIGIYGSGVLSAVTFSLGKAALAIILTMFLGRVVVPKIIHLVASANSRELLLLSSVSLALGTAAGAYFLGISPAIGAFLAGVVISESQENHAIFSETRPLRDIFVALFFVSLGFMINPSVIFSNILLIAFLCASIIILKSLVVFFVSSLFGFRGRTAVANSFGLAQVGEFAFVIFSSALSLKLIGNSDASIGIAVTLLSLAVSPLLYRWAVPIWRSMRNSTFKWPNVNKFFLPGEARVIEFEKLKDHIVICGYGRVGSWIGKIFEEYKISFVVVDYNQQVVNELKDKGILVVYGDPTEPEVMEQVNIPGAKAIILAIPDRVVQETLIAYVQTVAPSVKIIGRAHLDSDWDRLKTLRVDKIVQPEFEAAVEIARGILSSFGKPKEEIRESIKRLRMSHSKI